MKKLFVQILFTALAISPILLYSQNESSGRLSLEECISTGLQNNPGFQSSQLFVKENKTKVDEAHSGYYPTVSVNSNANVYSNNEIQRNDNYSTGISASYNLYNGSRVKATYNAAVESYNANVLQHESFKQDLTFNIIYAYYKTLQAERILRSAEQAVKNSELHLEYAKARNEAGVATLSDILKSEVELSNAELEKIRASNTLLAAKGNLNQLMGLPSNNQLELIDDLSEIDESALQSYELLLDGAINARTEVKRYLSLLNAQQSNIQVAQSGFYPALNANVNYNFSGEELSGMQSGLLLGMTLTIPVFKGFSTKARVTGEELALEGLEKELQSLKQQIGQEVWNAYLAVKESSERMVTTTKGMESASENLSISEGEYKEGIGSIIQLTDAQTTFVAAEQNYIQSVADYKISLAELKRTIGNL